jgi:hypothetical protein
LYRISVIYYSFTKRYIHQHQHHIIHETIAISHNKNSNKQKNKKNSFEFDLLRVYHVTISHHIVVDFSLSRLSSLTLLDIEKCISRFGHQKLFFFNAFLNSSQIVHSQQVQHQSFFFLRWFQSVCFQFFFSPPPKLHQIVDNIVFEDKCRQSQWELSVECGD